MSADEGEASLEFLLGLVMAIEQVGQTDPGISFVTEYENA